jgi:hypothetical protein
MNVAIIGLSCLMYVTRGSAGQVDRSCVRGKRLRASLKPPRFILEKTIPLPMKQRGTVNGGCVLLASPFCIYNQQGRN